jgi:hypothetical protein
MPCEIALEDLSTSSTEISKVKYSFA